MNAGADDEAPHRLFGEHALYFSGDFEAAQQNAMRGRSALARRERVRISVEEVDSRRPSLVWRLCRPSAGWHFGEIASCQADHGRSDLTGERAE